ncbi:MAG TPA: ABC transporter permease [Gaiellaceae bacterium]|nr:ABC transporter permease [Gaiellaceae bacterium]
MSASSAGFPAGSAELRLDPLARLGRLVTGTGAMARVELQKLRHDNLDILTRSVQPLLWLFVFGTALQHARSLNGGYGDYRAYIAPGVMAQAALFVAIFYGLAVIWERDLGQLQRLLATPMPRLGIVLGKASGASVRALVQAVVLLAVLAVARIHIHWSVGGVLGSLVLLALGTASFACLSMVLAALVKTRERFMGIGQLVAMPLFFASSALYPLALLPLWLRAVARVNPLTYEVEGMRRMLLSLPVGDALWVDFAVTFAFLAVFAGLAARLYPRAIL